MRAARSGDSAPPSRAASADPRRAEGCRGRSLLRVRRGWRLHAPSRRFHDGSNGGPGAENALCPVPDAESAEVRRPPLPRTGNSPCAPNAFAAPAEAWEAERARGDRRVRRIRWKAGEASADASGCDRPRLRELARMRGTRHARYLQTLPQIYSYAAYLTQLYPYAEYATAEYAYADIT